MYIIRTVFWVSVALLLIPSGNEPSPEAAEENQEQSSVSAGDAVNAALSAVGDLASLCQREPAVCETGAAAWGAFQDKAVNSVNFIYRWVTGEESTKLQQHSSEPQTNAGLSIDITPFLMADNSENADNLQTGSTGQGAPQEEQGSQPPSQGTLKLEDLIPSWGGPYSNERA